VIIECSQSMPSSPRNVDRGYYAITADLPTQDRIRVAFEELA
jgi:hypothetical protein